jgi:glycosyltransferase involved in cell wall biosynthesis
VFLGVLDSAEMPAFFTSADVLVVASVSGVEAFGMVQVEAMLTGTPVVATNLPGVRDSVKRTGMGLLVPPRDPGAIADAVRSVIDNRMHYQRSRREVERLFDAEGALLTEQELLANPRS